MGGTAALGLRFEGFEEAWSLTPLSSLYTKHEERNAIGLGEDKTISVASMTFNPEGSGAEESSLPNYKLLRIGDAAYEGHKNNEYAYGRFVVNDIGIGLMSPRFTALRPVSNLPVTFWSRYMHDENVMRGALVRSTKLGTMMNELVVDDFLSQEIFVPKLAEQEKIGALFERLDSLIEGRASELERLKRSKAALLAKMFPGEGEDEPEVRFAGFDGAWERTTLGEVGSFRRGERFTAADYAESGIPCIHYGEIYTTYGAYADRTVSYLRTDLSGALRYAQPNDIILAATSENVEDVCKAVAWLGSSPVAIHDDSYAFSHHEDPLFLSYFLETDSFFAQKSGVASGIKVMRVSSESLASMSLALPSLAEQQKIGELFQCFDELIAAREQELACLRRAKRALLQAMFV